VHWPIERAGIIGLPLPEVAIKMVPSGGKLEMRVKGPNVTPGYFKRDDLTRAAFDEQGYYRIGDAGKLADPDDPAKGLMFDGRIAEDFKLTSGTWVLVGALRVHLLEAAAPLVRDAVITGADRDWVGALVWLNEDAAAKLREREGEGAVARKLKEAIGREAPVAGGASMSIRRIMILTEPPSIDGNEITDKGYINQRAVLERRAAAVEALYGDPEGEGVVAAA
jgi:feruloyl-CoA synthase